MSRTTAPRGQSGILSTLVPPTLLIALPAYAIAHHSATLDWRYPAITCATMSVISFLAYRADKRRAEAGHRRVPETMLHLADLLGGWPGGLVAQHRFRHKTAKGSFQVPFWITVLVYQYVALDSLRGASLTTGALRSLRGLL